MGVKMEVKWEVMRYAQDICWGDSRTQDIGGTPSELTSMGKILEQREPQTCLTGRVATRLDNVKAH